MASRTIPRSGGYETPQLAAESVPKVCIGFNIRGSLNGDKSLEGKIRKIGVFSLAISNATLAELYFGAYNSKKTEENLKRITVFKKYLTVYSDSAESAMIFGKFKSKLKSEGDIIEDFDILIASIAFVNNCILVTNNPRHFQRIEELRVENWML